MVTKKPSKKIRQLCKKLKIKTTLKRGGKRMYKSNAVLIKQIRKMKRRTLSRFGACGCGKPQVPMFGKKRKVRYGSIIGVNGPRTVMNFGKKRRTSKRRTSKRRTSKRRTSKKNIQIRKLHKLCKLYKVKIGKKSNAVLRKQCLKKAKQMLKKVKRRSRFGSFRGIITGNDQKGDIKKLEIDKLAPERMQKAQQEFELKKLKMEKDERDKQRQREDNEKKQKAAEERKKELDKQKAEKAKADNEQKQAAAAAKRAADEQKKAADAAKKAEADAKKAADKLAASTKVADKQTAAVEKAVEVHQEAKAAVTEAKAAPAAAFGKRFSNFGSTSVSKIENKIPSAKKSKIKKGLYNALKKAGYKLGDYTDYTLKALLKMTIKFLGPIILASLLVKYRVKVYNTLISKKDREDLEYIVRRR
jgi:predicted  nucleic acid-binding Zn-ribbon protein